VTLPDICDYEGSDYRTAFWEGQGRDYEDRVERIAIRRLLPPTGERLLELGAGFGRLTNLYTGYRQVVLLDYSRSHLEHARDHYGPDGYLYVAADVYHMPFAPAQFDAATMVRTLHHIQDVPAAFRQIRMAMRRGGVFVLEHASKRHIKAIARWLLRRQEWNPFDREPYEFEALHFDFHPADIVDKLREAGFAPGRRLTVSHFRAALLKRLLPTGLLVAMDSLSQWTGSLWQLTPSVFVRSEAAGEDAPAPEGGFWRCPACEGLGLEHEDSALHCPSCGRRWAIRDGIYDFKEPLS
jgi:SAM-dependent methyltransferase